MKYKYIYIIITFSLCAEAQSYRNKTPVLEISESYAGDSSRTEGDRLPQAVIQDSRLKEKDKQAILHPAILKESEVIETESTKKIKNPKK